MRHRDPIPPRDAILTLGQIAAREPRWVRLYCDTPGCGRHAAVALVPLILRWGPQAPRRWLESRFRCTACGRRNTSIRAPSMMSFHGPEPFPGGPC
ncbi:MAG: hypothetical protein Q8K13_11790 [Parvibaculum sp.]|uniref:hypothetical protein n=1 Tax=Parvibaculum sp. TaxID=2024848 RepID=UPI00273145DC|nr:hypothetical protein [Parvibaculum sp.]MDP2150312.1 hypothetical protein [Parvibaculum sp.]